MRTNFLVTLKAFGDFVIAANALRTVRQLPPGCDGFEILAGEHVRQLAAALQLESRVRFIPSGGGVPPAFDVRSSGVPRALASLYRLRQSLTTLPVDCELIFPQSGWREWVLSRGFRHANFARAPNIYQAGTATLRASGYLLDDGRVGGPSACSRGPGNTAAIFPSSRHAFKAIPPAVISRVVEQLRQAGLQPEVIALAGEELAIPAAAPVRQIERNFAAVSTAIAGATLVVSSDSLPAHLAEYLSIPSYVITPVPNEYWLPLSAFLTRGWSLFPDERTLPAWLEGNLEAL
jgi:hypothetical protein